MDSEYASELFSYVDDKITLLKEETQEMVEPIRVMTEGLWENHTMSRNDIKEIVIEVLMEKGIITPEDFSRLDSSKIGELYNF